MKGMKSVLKKSVLKREVCLEKVGTQQEKVRAYKGRWNSIRKIGNNKKGKIISFKKGKCLAESEMHRCSRGKLTTRKVKCSEKN
jgi:hypothetical protein